VWLRLVEHESLNKGSSVPRPQSVGRRMFLMFFKQTSIQPAYLITNAREFEFPPPGAEFLTTTCALPAEAMRAFGT